MSCRHEDFNSSINVHRLIDSKSISIDIQIRCSACKEPVVWKVPRMGLLPNDAAISVDGQELRVPAEISGWGGDCAIGFQIKGEA